MVTIPVHPFLVITTFLSQRQAVLYEIDL